MELAKQVANLEISKKLKELGFKKENYFEHKCHYPDGKFICTKYSPKDGDCDTGDMKIQIPAYSASELMEYLPRYISPFQLHIVKGNSLYVVSYWKTSDNGTNEEGYESNTYRIESETLVDALGLMLIYLLEHNLIDTDGDK